MHLTPAENTKAALVARGRAVRVNRREFAKTSRRVRARHDVLPLCTSRVKERARERKGVREKCKKTPVPELAPCLRHQRRPCLSINECKRHHLCLRRMARAASFERLPISAPDSSFHDAGLQYHNVTSARAVPKEAKSFR